MKNQINLKINKQCSENQEQKKKFSVLSKIGLVCLALFSLSTIQAQTDHSKQKTQTTQEQIQEKEITVKGTVSNDTEVLPGVNIFLDGTGIGTETNLEGYFVFPKPLKIGDVLVFSYLGMESQKVIINNTNSASKIELKVDMNALSTVLLGNASSKKVYKSKRK